MLALPIFTARHQATIVGANELNFCVRDGNRWTLTAINTNSYGWGCFPIVYVKVPSDSNRFFAKQRFATYRYETKSIDKELVTRTGFEPMLTA